MLSKAELRTGTGTPPVQRRNSIIPKGSGNGQLVSKGASKFEEDNTMHKLGPEIEHNIEQYLMRCDTLRSEIHNAESADGCGVHFCCSIA